MYLCIRDHGGAIVLHKGVPAEPATFLEAISIPNAFGTVNPASRQPSSRSLPSSDHVVARDHGAFCRHELRV
jgi:hypothetical protein